METVSFKALAIQRLKGNLTGNRTEAGQSFPVSMSTPGNKETSADNEKFPTIEDCPHFDIVCHAVAMYRDKCTLDMACPVLKFLERNA